MFDTSNRQVCTVRQARTNTPLPSLRLALAWRQATARSPTATEQKVLLAGYQRVLKQYQGDPKAAEKLVSSGEWPRDKTLDVAEHAALAAMANMILNLDGVITKE
jgi:hypothetical protein